VAGVRSSFVWVLPAVVSIGCSSEIDHGPFLGSDPGTASEPRDGSENARPTGATTSTTAASACDTGASWGARNDLVVERSSAEDAFAETVSILLRQSAVVPIAVSSHMDPGCVWVVAFSASDGVAAVAAEHAAAFTPMLRHPAGLWTAAPQSTGWLHIVDRASRAVWLPLVDITGSATYGEASCASLAAVRVSAAVLASAGSLSLTTAEGERTVRELMGTEPPARGWDVRFTFSADMTR